MPSTIPFVKRIILTLLSLTLCLAALPAFGQTQQSNETRELPPGQTLERELTGAEIHRYHINLNKDEFFQVRVEQKGVDVSLKLLDASGNILATMDSPNGKEGFETLTFVAAKAGNLVLEVGSFDTKAEKGIYAIKREASRTATEKDKRRVEIERVFAEGMTARNTAGQRELAVNKLKAALAGWEELGDNYLKELTAQQVGLLAQVPPEINAIIERIKKEQQDALKLLGEGQKLMAKSSADSLSAREKLNQALTRLRSVSTEVRDKNLLDKVSQSGGTANQSLNSLKILEFQSKIAEALSLNGIAQTHANLNERQEAIDVTKQAIDTYQGIISDKTFLNISGIDVKKIIPTFKFNYAASLGSVGFDLAQYFGKSEEGIRYLIQAVETYHSLYQETQDPKFKFQIEFQEASTLSLIGTIYGRESKSNDKAIEFLTRSLEIFRALPNGDEYVAGDLSSIAVSQSLNYDYKDALENLEKALAIYRRIDHKSGQSNILRLIGSMYWVLNNKAKVAEYANQNLAILQSPDFAESWKKRLNPNGFGIYNELDDAFIEQNRLDSIAHSYRLLEDYQKSLEYYEKSLAIAPSLKDIRTVRLSTDAVASTFAKLEKWDKAAEFYKQALEISRKQGVREDIADDLKDVGWALLEGGKPSEALTYQNEALSIYQSVSVNESKAFSVSFSDLLNELSHSHYALGNKRLAIFYGKRAVNAMQSERQRLQNLDPVAQKGFLERKEKHYRRLVNWLIEEGRLPEAEQVLAMLKEEEVLSYLRRDASEADKLQRRPDLSAEERDALTRYNAIADHIAAIGAEFGQLQELKKQGVVLSPAQQKRYDELAKEAQDANNIFQAFLKQLAEEFAKRTNVKKDLQENLALKSDLKRWGEGVVFLYTLVGEDRYRVILTTPRAQVDAKYEITAQELNDKIEKFRAAVQNPTVDPRPLGKELYDILIKPIEKQLEGAKARTLLWSLDGNLRLLPFAALWDGRQYFGQKYQNVTITLASRTRLSEAVAPDWRVLGLGVTQSKTVKEPNGTREMPFSALPAVKTELSSIVRNDQSPNGILPGQILLDTEFNETALKQELVKGYKVIHIASHFSLNAGDATQSFLLMGDGQVLTVNELKTNEELSFDNVELLTLSACQTAVVEKDGTGKEIEGFGYVAQQKGAKAILATLWSVADESTQLLMSEFYRLRKERPELTKAAALQLAQQEMIEGRLQPLTATGQQRGLELSFGYDPKKPYAHPYYWSPFILIGNWR